MAKFNQTLSMAHKVLRHDIFINPVFLDAFLYVLGYGIFCIQGACSLDAYKSKD